MSYLLKKSFLLIIGLLFFGFQSRAQSITLKPGSILIYKVKAQGKKYDFIVTIKKISPNMVFTYEMTAPASKKGTVTIPKAEMDSAKELYNYFTGGDITLKGQTSVFLSRKVFGNLIEPEILETSFKVNADEPMTHFGSGSPSHTTYTVNGKKTDLLTEWFFDRADSSGYHYSFMVLRNRKTPLIMGMDLGWSINLSELKNVEIIPEDKE